MKEFPHHYAVTATGGPDGNVTLEGDRLPVLVSAPPAEFGEKTSVVINATTRSGQGLKTPTGSVTASYGSFGTSTAGFNLGYGGDKWGNFISVNGLNTF